MNGKEFEMTDRSEQTLYDGHEGTQITQLGDKDNHVAVIQGV